MAWLRRAAEAGHAQSLTRLAYINLYGLHDHEIDFERARRFFERAMAMEYPDAFVGLSRALYHGQNVEPDRRRARFLLDRAINLGSQEAKRNLLRYFPADEG
jgi:TPR repeat protein